MSVTFAAVSGRSLRQSHPKQHSQGRSIAKCVLCRPSTWEGRLKVEGAPVVAIDPDVDNARARRAYEKAGFLGDAIVQAGEGLAILMTFDGAV
jgi:RimJ/RimL family protein N-acetyltransferase